MDMCLLETQQKFHSKGGENFVSLNDRKEGTMEDIYYVLDLKSNILSMRQLF